VIKTETDACKIVKVLQMKQNQYLHMFFNKAYTFRTYDPKNETKIGDIIIVRRLPKTPTINIYYGIEKIVYKVDNIIDPITGRSNDHDMNELGKYLKQIQLSTNEPSSK
jgi:ribosomal protein S17